MGFLAIPAVASALGGGALGTTLASSLTGAVLGAAGSSATGGKAGSGALKGALGAGLGSALSGLVGPTASTAGKVAEATTSPGQWAADAARQGSVNAAGSALMSPITNPHRTVTTPIQPITLQNLQPLNFGSLVQ